MSAPTSLSQPKSIGDPRDGRTLTDIGKAAEIRSLGYQLPPRGLNIQQHHPVSYHANVAHSHHEPNPSAYNQMTIAPTTAFNLPSLSNTSSSPAALRLPPPPFPPHLTLHRPSPQHLPPFQSDSDHTSLPSLGQRLPSHFVQPSPLHPMSDSHSSAGSFTSSPFAPSLTYQAAQADTRNQPGLSAGVNTSFPSDECHRDVSIDVDMSGSHHSFNNDGGNSGEGGVWNPDGRVRPLSPRNDDVSQSGGAGYDPQGGQVGGGVRFHNYRLDRQQLSGTPPQDATEAIAKAMAAQRGEFGGGYKMVPLLPTFNLPNLNLQPRQEESSMTAGSRDDLPAPVSCAAPPLHASPVRPQWPQLSLRSPHTPGADSGTGVAVNPFVAPRPFLEGQATKEAEMKQTMRACLPRKEVCDHLVEYYVSHLHSSS